MKVLLNFYLALKMFQLHASSKEKNNQPIWYSTKYDLANLNFQKYCLFMTEFYWGRTVKRRLH